MKNPIYKTVFLSSLIAAGMFAFSFASVPLYNAVCRTTNFNKGTRISAESPDLTREITVQFVTTNNANLDWEFYPGITTLSVHPGENHQVMFYAKNRTNHIMTAQAIPSFAPPLAGRFFKKIQCFCFNKQTLKAGESINMPVIFRIDNQLPKQIHTITLAYTLFDLTHTVRKTS